MVVNLQRMKINLYKISGLLFAILFLGSCVPNKRLVYLQERNENATYTDSFTFNRQQYKLQPNDIVNVEIKAISPNPEFSAIFTAATTGTQNIASSATSQGGDLYYTLGYNINDSGYIIFPLLGRVDVAGLTVSEAAIKIQTEIRKVEAGVLVVVRLGGIRFSILGEVNRPGKFSALQSQLTLFEAIALAGDLKEIARRDKIVLVRQYPSGAKIHYLDILDKNIINSPYYFLQPNDFIYVEPLKRRAYGVGVNGLQTLTTVLTLISTTLVLVAYISK